MCGVAGAGKDRVSSRSLLVECVVHVRITHRYYTFTVAVQKGFSTKRMYNRVVPERHTISSRTKRYEKIRKKTISDENY